MARALKGTQHTGGKDEREKARSRERGERREGERQPPRKQNADCLAYETVAW